MSRSVVLDASALLAMLFKEAGGESVVGYLTDSKLSAVNCSEVVAKAIDVGMRPEEAHQLLSALPCQIIPFDHDHAFRAARLRSATKPLGLSLGDRACLSLGLKLGVPVVTADRSWADCNVGVQVIFIR